MEPVEKNEVLTLDNGKEYYVIDIINDEGKKYIFLSTDEKENDVILGEEIIENGEVYIETVDDPEIIKKIMTKIVDNNENE